MWRGSQKPHRLRRTQDDMNRDNNRSARDPYIDFMRALGLLLLVGIHVNAPEWYSPMRSFDVPLMAVVSAACYKSLTGGVFTVFPKTCKTDLCPCFHVPYNILRPLFHRGMCGRHTRLVPVIHSRQLSLAKQSQHRICLDNAGIPSYGDYAAVSRPHAA